MKRNIQLFFSIAILFTAIGAYFGNRQLHAKAPQPSAVQALFAASIPDLNNRTQALAQWKGKILLVNFWATWCAPCVQEMPELSALQMEMKPANLQVLGIGIDSAANIVEFSSKYTISYPVYAAATTGSRLLEGFDDQAGGLPFSVLIAPNGQIKKTYLGRLNMSDVKRDIAAIEG